MPKSLRSEFCIFPQKSMQQYTTGCIVCSGSVLERKGKERKGKERKGKERKGKKRKEKKRTEKKTLFIGSVLVVALSE